METIFFLVANCTLCMLVLCGVWFKYLIKDCHIVVNMTWWSGIENVFVAIFQSYSQDKVYIK